MNEDNASKPSKEVQYCASLTKESLKKLMEWAKDDTKRVGITSSFKLRDDPLYDEAIRKIYYKWSPIKTATKDGEVIEVSYGDGADEKENCFAFWSDNPICMLGPRNGSCPPGWATAGPNVDRNLPLDTPKMWRRIK